MATARLYNLARMTTATTGTGTVTLGSAVTGFLSFANAGVADGATVTYAIRDGNNSEIGRGVYTSSGTTLTRATVLNSTNSNNALNLSGSAEVFLTPSAQDFYPVTNAQTGTTYTVLATDVGKLVTLSNAASIAVTLPQATGLFGTGFWFYVQNIGAGTVTITPTTSTINGAATLVLETGGNALIVSDGTNYSATTVVASSTTVRGIVELATTAEAEAGVDTTRAVTPAGVAAAIAQIPTPTVVTIATEQATTSGTSFDFTSIPAGTSIIYVMIRGVSLSGSDHILVQLGDSGGIETSGYIASATSLTTGVTSTSGFIVFLAGLGRSANGILTLTKMGTDIWQASGTFDLATATATTLSAGTKTLSATLDRVRITRSGTDTFDAGAVNISYI